MIFSRCEATPDSPWNVLHFDTKEEDGWERMRLIEGGEGIPRAGRIVPTDLCLSPHLLLNEPENKGMVEFANTVVMSFNCKNQRTSYMELARAIGYLEMRHPGITDRVMRMIPTKEWPLLAGRQISVQDQHGNWITKLTPADLYSDWCPRLAEALVWVDTPSVDAQAGVEAGAEATESQDTDQEEETLTESQAKAAASHEENQGGYPLTRWFL